VAAASLDGTIKMWNLKDASLERIFVSEESEISSFVFMNNGKHLLVGYESGTLIKYDIRRASIISNVKLVDERID